MDKLYFIVTIDRISKFEFVERFECADTNAVAASSELLVRIPITVTLKIDRD